MMAVKTPLPIPVAAMAAGPSGPTMTVSTRPMPIQPISARTTGPARRISGRSSDTGKKATEARRHGDYVPPCLRVSVASWPVIVAALERDPEADLADALFGLSEVARVGAGLHEGRQRRARPAEATRRRRDERVLRVQEVEHLRDRLDARTGAKLEALAHAEVHLRVRRAPA